MKRWKSLRALNILVVLSAALFTVGCGGGSSHVSPGSGTPGTGGSGSSGTPVSGTPVAAESLKATFTATRAKLQEWDSLSTAERNQKTSAFLRTQPGVIATGVESDGTVWAHFTDDSYYVINDALVTASQGRSAGRKTSPVRSGNVAAVRPAVTRQALATPRRSAGSGTVEIPGTAIAYLLTGVIDQSSGFTGSLENPPNNDLKSMLEKRGYQVIRHDADVEFLKGIRDAGALHISTHGSYMNGLYGVYTSTEVTTANKAQYQDDLANHRLIYFEALVGYTATFVKRRETHYAITNEFVKHYGWTFAPNSFAFINCCWSNAEGFNRTLRDLPKGCTVTAGWTNAAYPETAWNAARFLFDRLLGTNLAEPKEPTAQRPFDIAAVYKDMDKRGLTDASTTEYGPCRLVVIDQPAQQSGGLILKNDYILAPSIEYMEVRERSLDVPTLGESRLTLHGMFGSEQGGVTIDGQPVLQIVSWAWDKIECKIADKPGAGFSGNVVVTTKNNVTSNAVPLTQWQGTFTYTSNPIPSVATKAVIACNVTFRADVHEYRSEPGGPLLKQQGKKFRAASGSTCLWEMQNGPPPGAGWVKYQSDMPYGLHGAAFPEYGKYGIGYILEGQLNPAAGTVAIAFDFLGCVASYTIPPVGPFDLATPRDPSILAALVPTSDENGEAQFTPNISGVLNPDYALAPGNATGITTIVNDTRFQWPAIAPVNPPIPRKGEDANQD